MSLKEQIQDAKLAVVNALKPDERGGYRTFSTR